ncbi:MAG: metallophosphoesterase [Lachnospiraceae bacterium]|nr:metallophosphoesterase [Lachnospiraceae bacterium]
MSDIHGDFPAFKRMLKVVDFKPLEDFLIVVGDVIDRGEHGVELLFMLRDMVDRGFATVIKGNHELFAQRYMEGSIFEKEWILNAGGKTLADLQALDDNKKSEFYDFIKQMPLYIERNLPKFGSTVITHTGLMESFLITDANDKIDVLASVKKAVETDEDDFLISADIHYWGRDQLRRLDKFIICGHIPTYQLGPEYTGKILENKAYMDIDAGSGYREQGGRLACYCIENEKVWYV